MERKHTPPAWLDVAGLAALIDELVRRGRTVVGPTVRDGAIVYDALASVADLPAGWTDEQDAGRYRLKRRDDGALFGYAVGPHSFKRYLNPPRVKLFSAHRTAAGFSVEPPADSPPAYAFLGVRPCELAAIALQDRVFTGSGAVDPVYAARRAQAFFIAVQCGAPSGTCFCRSMRGGPRAAAGFDLALTELVTPARHGFVVEAGSDEGAEVLAAVPHRDATAGEDGEAEAVTRAAAERMGRTLDAAAARDALRAHPEHPRWEEVGKACLTCANCTMACPTCFCSTVEDLTDLTGDHAERWRRWDSCFTLDFTRTKDGPARASAGARYRQWLTHKLATWEDQFGTSGCVGCGRCITWCPAGIDLTREARAVAS